VVKNAVEAQLSKMSTEHMRVVESLRLELGASGQDAIQARQAAGQADEDMRRLAAVEAEVRQVLQQELTTLRAEAAAASVERQHSAIQERPANLRTSPVGQLEELQQLEEMQRTELKLREEIVQWHATVSKLESSVSTLRRAVKAEAQRADVAIDEASQGRSSSVVHNWEAHIALEEALAQEKQMVAMLQIELEFFGAAMLETTFNTQECNTEEVTELEEEVAALRERLELAEATNLRAEHVEQAMEAEYQLRLKESEANHEKKICQLEHALTHMGNQVAASKLKCR